VSHPSAVSGAFGQPFTQQIAFFRAKLGNLVPTQRWDDMQAQAHDTGFMVAGAAKADLLTDLAAAVDKALSEGRGIEEFRRDFQSIVARNGWTGWTGEGSIQGEAWRVKTILRTNAYTSYSAGRHTQLLDGNFAFWVYRHGDSREPRPEHLALDGIALPPSHLFWMKFYPPSDWGCSCYALGARTAASVRRLGGNPSKTLPANWDAIDLKTGEPAGIGKGWGYAPGASVAQAVQAVAAKIGSWDYRVAKAFMEDVPAPQRDALAQAYRALPSTADDVRRYVQAIEQDRAPALDAPSRTLGLLTEDQIASAQGVKANGFDFSLSVDEVRHVLSQHGDSGTELARGQRAVTADDFALLPAILNAGQPRPVGRSNRHDAAVFEVTTEIGGETYVTRWEYRSKRRTLALQSFFIRTGKRA